MKIETYINRRKELVQSIERGIILLVSNTHIARNYKANPLPFRQDSSFLYFTGVEEADYFCLLDTDTGKEVLSGHDPTLDDAIWSGPQKSLREKALAGGFKSYQTITTAAEIVSKAIKSGRRIHYLPPYTGERKIALARILNKSLQEVEEGASNELIMAVIAQRSKKSKDEIEEIETALNTVTGPMHLQAMQMANKDIYEYEIVAGMYQLAKKSNMEFAYPVICSVRGETLHNESHANQLKEGQLLLVDAGVESLNHYASDITRTTPVGGKFSIKQKEIYSIVLEAQLHSIENMAPGILYRDIHLDAARIIFEGLKGIGIMKGDCEEAVMAGAHSLFFPHGLGHLLGLDVHDMEDLGENNVGYRDGLERSEQFGTAYLRFAKELIEDYVLTVEPGIYFIPSLIHKWKKESLHLNFINYGKLTEYMNFGGIRIEDNILITRNGKRVLGNPIIKSPDEIEEYLRK